MRGSVWLRAASIVGALAALFAAFLMVVRPWYLRWGATTEEAGRALAGDDIVKGARGQSTRAITIDAPVHDVWPWLAQLGQDRGGFYSYRVLENLVGCRMPDADRIHAEFLDWRVGDRLWMYPRDRAGGAGYAVLEALEPGRALAFGTWQIGTPQTQAPDVSWSFVLEPIDHETSRLLVRGRVAGSLSILAHAFDEMVVAPIHFVMERKMMVGLKDRAEGRAGTGVANTLEVLLWTATFGVLLAAGVLVFRRAAWWRALLVLLVAGALFQLLTLAQPGPGVGMILVAALTLALWWSSATCGGSLEHERSELT